MDQDARRPVQLAVFHMTRGDIYLSDRDLVVSGRLYEGLVEDWGELSTVGGVDGVAGTMELTLTLWNGGQNPFSQRYMDEDPVDLFVDLYQGFDGLEFNDFAHIGEFVIQDPIVSSESSSLMLLDLVSVNMRYFGQVGELLTKDKYPRALDADINKPISLIIGDAHRVQCLCSEKPAFTTLDRSVTRSTIRMEVTGDLDALGFTGSGYLQIDGELMWYGSRAASYFDVSHRGQHNTFAISHASNAEVLQAFKPSKYIIGQGPLSSVSDVRVKGQTTHSYTAHLAANPAYLHFSAQPTFRDSSSTRTGQVYFDFVAPANTALEPYYAIAEAHKAKSALISNSYRTLAIRQDDAIKGHGEIVNVFLEVEHWASSKFDHEYAQVWVSGYGPVGYLARPNQAWEFNFDADTDIDHPHDHSIADRYHKHSQRDPDFDSDNNSHRHNVTSTSKNVTRVPNNFSYPRQINYYKAGWSITHDPAWTTSVDGTRTSIVMRVDVRLNGCSLSLYCGSKRYRYWDSDDHYNIDTYVSLPTTGNMYFRVHGHGVVGGNVYFKSVPITIYYTQTQTLTNTKIPLWTYRSQDGKMYEDNRGSAIKDQNDVRTLAIHNRGLRVWDKTLHTPQISQQFDLLDFFHDISWSWFLNREVRIVYHQNGGDSFPNIFISYVTLRVEYREEQYRATDDVTCKPVGSISTRPDAVVQYLLTQKAGVPLGKLSSVHRQQTKLWDDDDTWDDTELWLDEGQTADVPEGAAFKEAAAWYAYRPHYGINGVLDADQSVKDAVARVTLQSQSRLVWQNGKVQMVILRNAVNWQIAEDLSPDDLQLLSIDTRRSNIDQVENSIDLCYGLDRLSSASGAGAYYRSVSVRDIVSIAKHGERVDSAKWLFDLCRNHQMAQEMADYYLWRHGETTKFYTVNTYLKNFHLEKEDYISISSLHLPAIKKIPLVINELVRNFGNGKLKKINLLSITGNSIRHRFYLVVVDDMLEVLDTLQIDMGSELDLADPLMVTDQLVFETPVAADEALMVSDDFSVVSNSNPQIDDTILAGDQVVFSLQVVMSDDLGIEDSFEAVNKLCFGSCGFGAPNCELPFGAVTQVLGGVNEQMEVSDVVSAQTLAGIEDDMEITDDLIFSDGFGCPAGLGDGFGLSVFGC